MVVNRFTQSVHLFSVNTTFIAAQVAEILFKEFFRLHGLPKSIVSDIDNKYLSAFWKELFKMVGMNLTPRTSYHPQTNGQTERLNQLL